MEEGGETYRRKEEKLGGGWTDQNIIAKKL